MKLIRETNKYRIQLYNTLRDMPINYIELSPSYYPTFVLIEQKRLICGIPYWKQIKAYRAFKKDNKGNNTIGLMISVAERYIKTHHGVI